MSDPFRDETDDDLRTYLTGDWSRDGLLDHEYSRGELAVAELERRARADGRVGDDLPVTGEWLEPLLEIEDSDHGYWWRSVGYSIYGMIVVEFSVRNKRLSISVNNVAYYLSLLDKTPITRGRFRRLCDVFDIPLKEKS